MTAFWAGEGFSWYQTKLQGDGKVVLAARGPVSEVTLDDEMLVVDGSFVIARTSDVKFTIRRPARSRWSNWLAGQSVARVYQGTGRLLMCTTPYWRVAMKDRNTEAPVCAN